MLILKTFLVGLRAADLKKAGESGEERGVAGTVAAVQVETSAAGAVLADGFVDKGV